MRAAFTATEPVWMSVKCDGAQSYTGTLMGTETKTFEASTAVTAMIGNAGGVTISLNGKPVGPVGGARRNPNAGTHAKRRTRPPAPERDENDRLRAQA